MHGAQQHLWMHADSPQKYIWTRACAPMQRCNSFFVMEAIANLSWVLREHRAGGCRLPSAFLPPAGGPALLCPPALLPPSCWQSVAGHLVKNPSKSTLAHDAVAAAVLRKHHLIIRVGAGLIQFVYGSRSHFANGGYPSQKCIFAIFARMLSSGQSQVSDGQPSWTSGTDSRRVWNVTKFLFLWDQGG